MRITLDNQEQPTNLITFSDIPNILKVEDTGGGTKAVLYILIYNNLSAIVTGDSQFYMTFFDDTITNVTTPENAVNKNFFISNNNASTVASIAKAFRNCPTISTNFTIENTTYDGEAAVKFTARENGSIFTGSMFYSNIPNGTNPDYIHTIGTDGSSNSELAGAMIDVDIYNDGKYVTTLEKNFYGSEAAFNISPVLTTFAEYGATQPYTMRISSIKNGDWSLLGSIGKNYISIGYMVNQGNKFLFGSDMIAQNNGRGENGGILYVYEPSIPLSFYVGESTNRLTITVDYLDSAFNSITSATYTWINPDLTRNNRLFDYTVPLSINGSISAFNQSFYVDVTVGSVKRRFNVIKPLKATEYSQRILWRNSYGGISFFDFTGQRSETRDVQISTYEKNIFNYYDDPLNELEKVYNNEVKYTVTLKSHLFANDGKYIFNDLLQSANVWTVINGENYAIIIDSVSVDETDNNGVFEATLKYHYSAEPSLI